MRRTAILLSLATLALAGCGGDPAKELMSKCQEDVQNGTDSGACDKITKILDEH